jgi:RNA-directed DNA polymerase
MLTFDPKSTLFALRSTLLQRVKGNKGSAGVDGINVNQLTDYLKQHWPVIREQLLNGTYEPKR